MAEDTVEDLVKMNSVMLDIIECLIIRCSSTGDRSVKLTTEELDAVSGKGRYLYMSGCEDQKNVIIYISDQSPEEMEKGVIHAKIH